MTLWLLLTIPATWVILYLVDVVERAWKHRAALRSEWSEMYRHQRAVAATSKTVVGTAYKGRNPIH